MNSITVNNHVNFGLPAFSRQLALWNMSVLTTISSVAPMEIAKIRTDNLTIELWENKCKNNLGITITKLSEYFHKEPKILGLNNLSLSSTSCTRQKNSGLPWLSSGLDSILPMQGTQVWSQIREPSPRVLGHNYWSPRALEPVLCSETDTALRSPRTTTKSSPRPAQLEKARTKQQRPSEPKINKNIF